MLLRQVLGFGDIGVGEAGGAYHDVDLAGRGYAHDAGGALSVGEVHHDLSGVEHVLQSIREGHGSRIVWERKGAWLCRYVGPTRGL